MRLNVMFTCDAHSNLDKVSCEIFLAYFANCTKQTGKCFLVLDSIFSCNGTGFSQNLTEMSTKHLNLHFSETQKSFADSIKKYYSI